MVIHQVLLFARSMAAGPRAAAPLAVGITAARLVLLAAAAAGVSAAAAALGPVFIAIKIAGAIYLAWLGIKMWRRPPAATTPASSTTPRTRPVRAVATGFALGVSNPQAIVSIALGARAVDVKADEARSCPATPRRRRGRPRARLSDVCRQILRERAWHGVSHNLVRDSRAARAG